MLHRLGTRGATEVTGVMIVPERLIMRFQVNTYAGCYWSRLGLFPEWLRPLRPVGRSHSEFELVYDIH